MKCLLLALLPLASPIQAQGIFNKAPTYAAFAIASLTDPAKLAAAGGWKESQAVYFLLI